MSNVNQMFRSPEHQIGLLDSVTDAIIIRNLDGKTLYWNHGAEILYGWLREQAIGSISHELLRTVFPIPFQNSEDILRDRHNWDGDLHQTARDGRNVVVSSRWAFWQGEEHQIELLEINRDITAQKQLQEGFVGLNRE